MNLELGRDRMFARNHSSGNVRERRFLQRGAHSGLRLTDFWNSNRVTFIPCISAEGDVGQALFVFKGTKLPYRRTLTTMEME